MPSSLHEVIAVSASMGDPNELAQMVAEINMDQVSLDERLSNQVYHYDESRYYHNIVFKGNDKSGITRFASMRGVFDKDGNAFKCDVAGNDKNYGFNVVSDDSEELIVFEAAIVANACVASDGEGMFIPASIYACNCC